MKYCSRCGKELYDEAVVSIGCGCPVDDVRMPFNKPRSDSWNSLSIVGFILSFFTSLIGLILSIVSYRQVKESGEKGKELSIAGIIISLVKIAIYVFAWILIIWLGLTIQRNGGM